MNNPGLVYKINVNISFLFESNNLIYCIQFLLQIMMITLKTLLKVTTDAQ